MTAAAQMINTRNNPGIHRAAENIALAASQPASGIAVATIIITSQSGLIIGVVNRESWRQESRQSR
jgi:hypothetical protein